jgi:hypothetical protein
MATDERIKERLLALLGQSDLQTTTGEQPRPARLGLKIWELI